MNTALYKDAMKSSRVEESCIGLKKKASKKESHEWIGVLMKWSRQETLGKEKQDSLRM